MSDHVGHICRSHAGAADAGPGGSAGADRVGHRRGTQACPVRDDRAQARQLFAVYAADGQHRGECVVVDRVGGAYQRAGWLRDFDAADPVPRGDHATVGGPSVRLAHRFGTGVAGEDLHDLVRAADIPDEQGRALKALVDIQSRQNAAAAVAAAAEQGGRSVDKRARRRRRGRGRQRGVGAGIKRLFGGDSEGDYPATAGASNATAGDVEQGRPSPSATVTVDTAAAPMAAASQEATVAVTRTADDITVRRPSEGSAYDAGSRAMLVAGAIGATYAAAASAGHPTDQLTWEEGLILGGALEFTSKTVEQIMTPLNKVFMLSAKARLNFKTMTIIFQSGHSRIPVYAQRRGNVVGVLFTKDLILIDPDDDIPVSTVLSFFRRELRRVMANVHLNVLLNEFKTGRGHMAVVQQPLDPAAVGIVTLEDVIEEIIQSEIVDETDVYRDNVRDEVVVRKRRIDAELLRMLDSSPRDERFLTEQEVPVIATYLASNFEEDFGPRRISPALLAKMLAVSPIVEYDRGSTRGGHAALEAALSRPRMSPTAATTVNPTAAAALPALDALPNASTAFGAEALSEGDMEDDEEAVERERRWRLLRRRSASFGEVVDADRLSTDWAALSDGDVRT
eukprot:ctg_1042.g381